MSDAVKPPWPRDAVIIVCATPEEARRDEMESVNPGKCRDCGRAIVYDGYTYRRALRGDVRRGRPIQFLCVTCATRYDSATITHFQDHRGERGESIEQIAARHREACLQDFGDADKCWRLLATGEHRALIDWGFVVGVDVLEMRAETMNCRLFVHAALGFTEIGRLEQAVDAARRHDITLQLLCVHEPIEAEREHHDLGDGVRVSVAPFRETYPILHLGSHGNRWPPDRK